MASDLHVQTLENGICFFSFRRVPIHVMAWLGFLVKSDPTVIPVVVVMKTNTVFYNFLSIFSYTVDMTGYNLVFP
jgi:hypothetical protein